MSTLTWLASSERERQEAMHLARLLQQKESRDELGIGSIRDGFADLLFPGTSTLHTRARYFLVVPWCYEVALSRGGRKSLRDRVRKAEGEFITSFGAMGDTDGLIGRNAGAAVMRMPSALYWSGLLTWGVRRRPGSQLLVDRAIERRPALGLSGDDGDIADIGGVTAWHRNLPAKPEDLFEAPTLACSRAEAEFLAERLRTEPGTRKSSLAVLARVAADHADVDFIWSHPHLAAVSADQQTIIEQARRFSTVMHGASWVYNVILAEKAGRFALAEEHRDNFSQWAAEIEAERGWLDAWNLADLWVSLGTHSRVPILTQRFVAEWTSLVENHEAGALLDRPEAVELITQREQRTKGRNARTVNTRALEQWGGYSATSRLDFRWSTARRLLTDIRDGLECPDAAH